MQEAHCTEKSSEIWAAEWGYTALFSSLTSNKVGVAVLFNNNFPFKILRQLCDKEGRYIIVDMEVGELTLTLCNIYAPNTDDPAFFKNVSEQMLSFKCDEIIIGGDFNLVMDVSKDKAGGKPTTHWNSLKELKYVQGNLDLTDIRRDLNPEVKRYTWTRNRPEVHCRLDFFLVNLSIAGRVSNADILPAYKTDHSLCKIDIKVKIKKMKNEEANIESALAALEEQLEQGVNNKDVLEQQIRCKKIELENIIQYKTKGAIIRSKARWYNEGEKNSKYFSNLENRHCKRKTITQIKTSNGSYATNDLDILKEFNSFYSRLYASKKPTVTLLSDNLFFGQEHPTLNDIDKQKCEGLLSGKECLEALKTMEPGKSPGTDGLPVEFYEVFWKDVSPFLIRCLNKSHQKGKLALTQRRGIISLIPKKDTALQELKNWRPITLLNCD